MSTVHEAMAAVMKDVPAIAKNQKNVDQGYAARSIDDIYDSLHALFSQHGLICLPRAGTGPGEFEREWVTSKQGTQMCHVWQVVHFDFYSADGSGPLTMSARSEGRDASDKASNKAGSGAHKYALIQAFQIPVTGDTDPDVHHEEAVRETPPETAGQWLASAVQMFKEWTEDDRREEVSRVMKELGVVNPMSMSDAKRVHKQVSEVYYEANPPSGESAPF